VSVGLVLVTHGAIGAALLAEAEFILGEPLAGIASVGVGQTEDPQDQTARIRSAILQAERGGGVLVLTDLIGASPANRAAALLDRFEAVIVTGLNLGIRLCAWANRDLTPDALARQSVACGRRGVRRPVTIINKLGLHARAATRLVSCASAFEADVRLVRGARTVNAKSIMGVLTLAAAAGTELVVEADGPDEDQALEAIAALIDGRFGEQQ